MDAKSLDAHVGAESDNEDCTLSDMIPGKINVGQYVLDKIQREELREIWDLVDELPGNYAKLFRFRYQQGMTLQETDRALGKTARYTSGAEGQALRKLKRSDRARRLFEYLME